MRSSADKNIKVNLLNTSKLILTALITILTICDLVYAISYSGDTFAVHFYTPVIKIATFVSILFWEISIKGFEPEFQKLDVNIS